MRFIPLFICCMLSISLLTQNLEFAGQFYSKSQGQRIIPTADGNWFFAGKLSPGLWEAGASTVIYGLIKNNGDLFPFTPIQDQDDADAVAIFQKANGHYLVYANTVDCEVFTGGILYEINTAGNVVVATEIPLSTPQNIEIKQYQDNLFMNTSDQILQLFDSGNFMPFINTTDQIQAFIPIYSNLFFIGYHDLTANTYGLRKVDSQSTVLATLELSGFGSVQQMAGLTFDRNVILQEQRLTLFNDNLADLGSQSLAIVGIEYLRMAVDDNSIWVLAKDSNERFFVYGYDYALNPLQNFAVDLEGKVMEDITIANGKIALVGTENSGTYQDTLYGVSQSVEAGNNFWIKTFDKGNSIVLNGEDISLDEVHIASSTFAQKSIGCDGGNLTIPGVAGSFQNLQLVITNRGSQVLNTIEANVQIYGCPLTTCDLEEATFLNQQYSNLNLQPGATMNIPFDNFAANFSDASLPQVCIWLSVPNNKIDQNASDNVHCEYFPATVANREFDEFASMIQHFPNPVRDELNIIIQQPLGEVVNVYLYNAFGQLVFEQKEQLMIDGMTIDMKDSIVGLYFLSITTTQGESIYHTQVIKP